MIFAAEPSPKGRLIKRNQGSLGLAGIPSVAGRDAVIWKDGNGEVHTAAPGRALLNMNLHEARRARTAGQHKGQTSYHGLYWLSQLDRHIWFESLFEKTAIMWLDFELDLRGFASQPMWLHFSDGTQHVPDFFMVRNDGRQVLLDVKPLRAFNEKVEAQFDNTRRICDAIGWAYELFTEIDPYVKTNLEWLAGYRDPNYCPDDEKRERVLREFATPKSFGEAIRLGIFRSREEGVRSVCSLLWTHHLRIELSEPLTERTTIRKDG